MGKLPTAFTSVGKLRNQPNTITPSSASAFPSSQLVSKKIKFGTQAITQHTLGRSTMNAKKSAQQLLAEARKKAQLAEEAKSNMVFNKGHGQHILKNPLVINAIVEKSGIKSTDVVLEIGPGTGNLTEKLLQVAKKVIAFEIDPRMVAELHKRFQNSPLMAKLTVVKGNCLDHAFPYFDRCVANVPYAISSALVFKLLRHGNFKCAVLMFQREFALRCCALPGTEAYCRLSVNTQLLSRCSHLMKISKNSFNPPPKVESSVIRLEPKNPPPPVEFDEWDGFVKMVFNRKNKRLTSIFKTKAALQSMYDKYLSYVKLQESLEKNKNITGAKKSKANNAATNANDDDDDQQQQMPLLMLEKEQFKAMVETILADAMFEGRRGKSMDLGMITEGLNLFHKHGIYFA